MIHIPHKPTSLEADTEQSILILSRYARAGASSRYRFYQYLPAMEAAGYRVTLSPLFDDEYLLRRYRAQGRSVRDLASMALARLRTLLSVGRFDAVILEKELFPYAPALLERFVGRRIPLIVDYDDAIFHQYDHHANHIVRLLLSRKIARVIRAAALVTVGNRYLLSYAEKAGARAATVLPTVVDLARYPPSERRKGRDGPITIGWIGSPSTSRYVSMVAPALREVCRGGRARVVLIGSGAISLDGVAVEVLPWTEAGESGDIGRFDVGIMPLPDNPWERGKCGLKLIQYMACGIPVVASPVGVNSEIVEDRVSGFLACETSDWVRALGELRDSPGLRERMGMAGRARVEARYSLDVASPLFLDSLSRVIGA